MRTSFSVPPTPQQTAEARLMRLAAVFVLLQSIILTLAPAVRLHSWQAPYRWQHWLGTFIWLIGFALISTSLSRILPEHNPFLLPAAALLTGWGLLTIWRLDEVFGLRQSLWLAITLLVVWGLLRVPNLLNLLHRYQYIWLVGGLAVTILTFFFGTYPGGVGPRLWLGFYGVYFQPSEPLKLLLVIYLAAYLSDRLPMRFNFLQLLMPTILLVGTALVVLVAQRDLGTASIFLFLYAAIVYIASGRRRILLISAIAILLAGVSGYFIFDVIRIRLTTWFNPWLDPGGGSFQVLQSLMAVASGGVFGRGLGLGSPGLVPVAHSDFIFSAIAEESGLIGSLALILVIALLCSAGFQIALRAADSYRRYLAAGLAAYLCAQALLIVGGNLRLLPLTGVTLPFVSYGGSSLLTSFIALLLLLLISSPVEDEEPAVLARPTPIIMVGSLLLVGLASLSLINGWWSFLTADRLLERHDNPRRVINDRYVLRGEIFDRTNQPLAISTGKPGEYIRQTLYPPLAPVIGYTHPIYGQAGVESSLDGYLRGTQGNPASTIWLAHILYGQSPPGLNLRLALHLPIQKKADELLTGHRGTLVLLNARTGEILAMSSQPGFDPNQLDTQWETWINDPNSPLLNRAAQGLYPPGSALGIFLLTNFGTAIALPEVPSDLSTNYQGNLWRCALPTTYNPTWPEVISAGCPGATHKLASLLTPQQLLTLDRRLGFTLAPDLSLPVALPPNPLSFSFNDLNQIDETLMAVSPLQMALAAAGLSNGGTRPSPRIALAVQTPSQGWVVLPTSSEQPEFSAQSVQAILSQFKNGTTPIWQSTATAWSKKGQISWYLAGTLPDWQGTPLALALVLEENNPELAQQIGFDVLQNMLNP